MAMKAIVKSVAGFSKGSTNYSLVVNAVVATDDENNSVEFQAEATSANFNPVLPNWNARVKQAVIDAAEAQSPSLEVDDVLWPGVGLL